MASVHKAYVPALDRYIAIKVLAVTWTYDPAPRQWIERSMASKRASA